MIQVHTVTSPQHAVPAFPTATVMYRRVKHKFHVYTKGTYIFSFFRSLRNNRTRIHKNLFIAMVIQVVIRLTLYIDQAVIRGASSDHYSPGIRSHHRQGIDNTVSRKTYRRGGTVVCYEYRKSTVPQVCHKGTVLLEYSTIRVPYH